MSHFFQVLQGPGVVLDGKHKLDSAVTELYNGMCLKLASDGELEIPTSALDEVYGLAYEPAQVTADWPENGNLATAYAGKYLTVVKGKFLGLVSHELINGGSVPATLLTKLRNNGDGYFKTSGTTPVLGTITQHPQLQDSPDPDLAVTYEVMAVVDFNI